MMIVAGEYNWWKSTMSSTPSCLAPRRTSTTITSNALPNLFMVCLDRLGFLDVEPVVVAIRGLERAAEGLSIVILIVDNERAYGNGPVVTHVPSPNLSPILRKMAKTAPTPNFPHSTIFPP